MFWTISFFTGLLRLQQLYKSLQPGKAPFRITNVKRVSNATEVVTFLVSLEKIDRWSNKYVILDCGTQLAKDALILHVRDVHLGRRNYHYLLSGLVSAQPVIVKPMRYLQTIPLPGIIPKIGVVSTLERL